MPTKPSLRLLLMGPLPPPIGGNRVSLKILVDALRRRDDVDLRLIQTPPVRRQKIVSVFRFVMQVGRLVRQAASCDLISLHCTLTSLPVRGLVVLWIARLFRKPVIVRTFGGLDFRRAYGPLRRAIIRHVLRRVDLYLAQTKSLVRLAERDGFAHVEWYPTSRPMAGVEDHDQPASGPRLRFVYLGHVRELKGISETIAAGERQPEEVTVDVYGPFRDGMTEAVFEGCRRVRYRGVVAPDQVVGTLRDYDAFLMPTRAETEGYPGTILEAYAAGIPVIATRCGAIPEIVADGRSGLLIDAGDADALYDAMRKIVDDDSLAARLRAGAVEKRQSFASEYWADVRFVELCRQVVERVR